MNPVLAGFVGSGCHDAALGRVAIAADNDRAAPQLRSAQDLDGRDELIEVDMQHPAGHHSSVTRRLRCR